MLTRLLLALLLAVTAAAQSSVVGTWKLVSAKQFNADGTTVPEQFGPNPRGFLTYTADGHMHAILTNGARPPLSVDDRVGAPEAERAQAFATGFAYAGTYRITAGKVAHHVTHHVLVATVPNWVGQDFVRRFQLDGDTLTIVTEGAMVNHGVKVDRVELVWQRDSAPTAASADDTIKSLDQQLMQAAITRDATKFAALADPDYYTVNEDGSAMALDAVLAEMRGPNPLQLNGMPKMSEYRIRHIGNTALLTARTTWMNEDKIALDLRYLEVWINHDGAWKFAHWQATRVTPEGLTREARAQQELAKSK
jgi:hypothetical protein